MKALLTDQAFGALGERFAVKYLKRKHYKILCKNYKCDVGEIDIIARSGEELVFVEVKTRGRDPYLSGMYAVDRRKQEHILRTAARYIKQRGAVLQPRFDVVEVEVDRASGRLISVHHIESAFAQQGDYARF